MYKYWKKYKYAKDLPMKLKMLRIAAGLTQRELAETLKISRTAVSNYENGTRSPDYEILKIIANFFDVLVDYLVGDEDYKTMPVEKDKIGEYNMICKRVKDNGDSIDISGISVSKKLSIINYCEYVLSTEDNLN